MLGSDKKKRIIKKRTFRMWTRGAHTKNIYVYSERWWWQQWGGVKISSKNKTGQGLVPHSAAVLQLIWHYKLANNCGQGRPSHSSHSCLLWPKIPLFSGTPLQPFTAICTHTRTATTRHQKLLHIAKRTEQWTSSIMNISRSCRRG